MHKFFLLLIGSIFLYSCSGFDYKENIFGNYYLVATDVADDMSLSYHEADDNDIYGTVIEATVFAIAYDKNYIIVKQYPRYLSHRPERTKVNYYILPIKKGFNWRTNNGLIGPLTASQFKKKCFELKVNKMDFRTVYE